MADLYILTLYILKHAAKRRTDLIVPRTSLVEACRVWPSLATLATGGPHAARRDARGAAPRRRGARGRRRRADSAVVLDVAREIEQPRRPFEIPNSHTLLCVAVRCVSSATVRFSRSNSTHRVGETFCQISARFLRLVCGRLSLFGCSF